MSVRLRCLALTITNLSLLWIKAISSVVFAEAARKCRDTSGRLELSGEQPDKCSAKRCEHTRRHLEECSLHRVEALLQGIETSVHFASQGADLVVDLGFDPIETSVHPPVQIV